MKYTSIIKNIVNDRNEQKIYQYEMAEELGVDERTYRSIEKGTSKLSLEQYLLVCNKLKKSPTHYLGGNGNINNGTINGMMNNGELNLNANNMPEESAKTFQYIIEALVDKMNK